LTRVRFFSPDDEVETGRYMERIKSIDVFWREFGAGLGARAVQGRGLDPAWIVHLRGWLGRVEPGLGLEMETHGDGSFTLDVLAVEDVRLKPLADLMVERAPPRLPWSFSAQRSPASTDAALAAVRQDFGLDLSKARARVGVGRGHALEIVVSSEHFNSGDDEQALDVANALLGRLLGDAVFDSWVQTVSVLPGRRSSVLRVVGDQSPDLPLSLQEVKPAVQAAITGIDAGLPEQPSHRICERADWVMFELDPAEGIDGAPLANGSDDLLMATTMCPEMLRCFLSGELFASQRFSRFGEIFCYVKLELSGDDEQRVGARCDLEEALDRALVPGQLGCVVGAGLGARYCYIVLALTRLEPALQLVRKKLRDHEVPKNAWVLFCDSHWADEWVGIWDDTAPPASQPPIQ